jgi:hypothetical protein
MKIFIVLFEQIFKQSAFSFWLMRKITADKYRIFTYYLDISPVYEYVLFPPEQSETAAFAVNNDTADLRRAGVDLNIIDKAYTTARFYADNFFTSYIAEMAHHNASPPCFRYVL